MAQSIQSTFNFAPGIGVPGQLARTGECEVEGYSLSSRKLASVAITAVNGFAYSVTVNGTVYAFTADGSATTAEIAVGLRNAINAGAEPVVASGADTPLLIESKSDAENGADFADTSNANRRVTGDFLLAVSANLVATQLQAQGQECPAGVVVCLDERSSDDQVCRLPRQASDVTSFRFAGVVLNDVAKTANPVGAQQTLKRNTMISALEEGDVYVRPETAVAKGDQAFARFAVGAGGSQLGALRNDADSASAAALARCFFKTAAAAGELAVLSVER